MNLPEGIAESFLISNPQSLLLTLVGLVICVLTSFSIKYFYIRASSSIADRSIVANILPPLAICVFLLVSCVKNSLSLSLGTVGALSIIRFRTPVKSIEDLLYVFMAIATGISLGANQFILTVIVHISFVGIVLFQKKFRGLATEQLYDINIQNISSIIAKENLMKIIFDHCKHSEIARLDTNGPTSLEVVLTVLLKNNSNESLKLIDNIQSVEPGCKITIYRRFEL